MIAWAEWFALPETRLPVQHDRLALAHFASLCEVAGSVGHRRRVVVQLSAVRSHCVDQMSCLRADLVTVPVHFIDAYHYGVGSLSCAHGNSDSPRPW